MTDTNHNDNTNNDPIDPLTPPDEVQALFDEADETGPYAVFFTESSVQLKTANGLQVIREVRWPRAGQYGRNLQAAVQQASMGGGSSV